MRLSILLSLSILLAGCNQTAEEPVSATAQGTDQAAMDQPLADQPAEAIPPATAPAAGPARFDGYAGLRFGMDETEARSAWVGVLEGIHPDADPAVLRMRAHAVFGLLNSTPHSAAGLAPSTSEANRSIDQGGVRIDGERVSDRALELFPGTYVVQIGKRRFARVRIEAADSAAVN